ncbi:MAG TPA: glycosyltransferase family 2 protein [Paenibacillaceae bacterium]|nr:glycosyltransferase family 2 protein [Paenibacillaceae bacterium]
MNISIIIPAYNEEKQIPSTLHSLRTYPLPGTVELIVVDDGSSDLTSSVSRIWADRVIRLDDNRGKGFALQKGLEIATGDSILFIDADLGDSASMAHHLVRTMEQEQADLVIATFPPPKKRGFGLVKKWAQKKLEKNVGYSPVSPLCGQRILNRKAIEAIDQWDCGFGIEMAMLFDVYKAGLKVTEVPIPFSHRETKKDLSGFLHRGKQFIEIRKTVKQWKKECT